MKSQYFKDITRRGIARAYYMTGYCNKVHIGNLIILTYHRIVPKSEKCSFYPQPGLIVEPQVFEKHLSYLNSKYTIISFEEYFHFIETDNKDDQKQYCIITFDDGWKDNYDYAYPLLKKYGISATIFLVTDFIGSNEWLWPEKLTHILLCLNKRNSVDDFDAFVNIASKLNFKNELIRSLEKIYLNTSEFAMHEVVEAFKRYSPERIDNFIQTAIDSLSISLPDHRLMINWDEVQEMSHEQISFGSHGCSHKILTTLDEDEIKHEIIDSQKRIMEKQINYVPTFCCPNGNYNQDIIKIIKNSGYKASVTTNCGFNLFNSNEMFELKRLNIHNHVTKTPQLFSLHLTSLL